MDINTWTDPPVTSLSPSVAPNAFSFFFGLRLIHPTPLLITNISQFSAIHPTSHSSKTQTHELDHHQQTERHPSTFLPRKPRLFLVIALISSPHQQPPTSPTKMTIVNFIVLSPVNIDIFCCYFGLSFHTPKKPCSTQRSSVHSLSSLLASTTGFSSLIRCRSVAAWSKPHACDSA